MRLITTALLFLILTIGIASAQSLELKVLSSPSDLVTGGSALIEVNGAGSGSLSITLNGHDVSRAFRPARDGGKPTGRVDGLTAGKNVVEVRSGSSWAQLTLTNHPISGPAFSGAHQSPFVCQTAAAGLSEPLDSDCMVETRVAWFYRSTDPLPETSDRTPILLSAAPPGFKPFDPDAPRPADMDRTTTTEGETVDYIVRREVGTINRAIYQIAFLHDPRVPPPDPWKKAAGWNGRLVYSFGGGCRAGYRQGLINGRLASEPLSKGFATVGSSLNVFGNNCDDVISAETMMMVKEHFIESFGAPVHTIGTGGSGGSMQQHLIAQNYPGLLDGIIPGASYPDLVTLLPPVVDCALLGHALQDSAPSWTHAQKTAVSGFATWETCESWMSSFSPALLQPTSCSRALPKSATYDASTNPKGARCSIQDNQVNVYGRDPQTGFARRTFDNVGVQYALTAFNAGTISAEQFVVLNERVGGYDADANFVVSRSVADPDALRIAYRTGRVNVGGGSLSDIPIIDVRRYRDTEGDIHDRVRSFSVRARLMRANGSASNHVVLVNLQEADPVLMMDRWLSNIAEDTENGSAAEKTIRNRPTDLADACWTDEGQKIVEPAVYGGTGRCNQLYPAHADPRLAAGAPLTNDVLKCAVKPLDPSDYKQSLTPEQIARLRAVFPSGVCDYGRSGVGQANVPQSWVRY